MRRDEPDRGQAFTLEGLASAAILLFAVLFALQSVVITPSTGGAVDRTAQAQIQQQANDALLIAANDGNLSETVRYWDTTDGGFSGANDTPETRGEYTTSEFAEFSELGVILNSNLGDQQNYNVELVYQNENGTYESLELVNQGPPSQTAVTASYFITLHSQQNTTAPGEQEPLEDVDDPPIEPRTADPDDELYNVVEVRVIVW